MDIAHKNKVIGEFMGKNYEDPLNYLFDLDWNHLMPVCKKLGMKVVSTDLNQTYEKCFEAIMSPAKQVDKLDNIRLALSAALGPIGFTALDLIPRLMHNDDVIVIDGMKCSTASLIASFDNLVHKDITMEDFKTLALVPIKNTSIDDYKFTNTHPDKLINGTEQRKFRNSNNRKQTKYRKKKKKH
jgi:hypothetical protein